MNLYQEIYRIALLCNYVYKYIEHLTKYIPERKSIVLKSKYFKLLVCFSLIVSAVFSFGVMAAQTNEPKLIEYIVIAETANLRGGPGTSFERVGTVSQGDSLLIYEETPEANGWLRVKQPDGEDAYIADYLVEKAPQRFFPVSQEPLFEVEGRGSTITDVYEIPQGAYRIDAVIQDNSFILSYIVIEGDCRDDTIFNELSSRGNRLTISGLLVSKGCSVIFETDNTNSSWEFAVRDLLDADAFVDSLISIDDGSVISGSARSLTMPTQIPEGIWTIEAEVEDRAFILTPQVLLGDCDTRTVFNELDFNTNRLEASTVFRVPKGGCTIYWETNNVDDEWQITFSRLR